MRGLSLIAIVLFAFTLKAQDQPESKKKKWISLQGYIKNMQIFGFHDNINDVTVDDLIHNRLNFRLYPTRSLQLGLEIRNRIFIGETLSNIPGYAKMLATDPGIVDLNFLLIDGSAIAAISKIDRAWIDWTKGKWAFRAGRQRINWGMNLFWNSNDLFNAYSLVDFDYEERPGTDAIRIQRQIKGMNGFDFALSPSRDSKKWIGALAYKFNKWKYDFQLLAGWWKEDIALGAGWAGNIGNAGFKGELTWFQPRAHITDTTGSLSASVSADYVFPNKMFATAGLLLNTKGVSRPLSSSQNLFLNPFSAKTLMPMKYSAILSLNYPFSPLYAAGLTGIFSPGVNAAFLMPSLTYSVENNWELSLLGQFFWMDTRRFQNIGNGAYIRIKGSF